MIEATTLKDQITEHSGGMTKHAPPEVIATTGAALSLSGFVVRDRPELAVDGAMSIARLF